MVALANPSAASLATSFIYFPLLPTELRLNIWRYAESRRIVKVRIAPDHRGAERPWTALTNYHAYTSRHSREFRFRSLTCPPVTLAVNHESREEIRKSYVLISDTKGPRFYFHPSRDMLYVEQHAYHDDWVSLLQHMKLCGVHVRGLAIHDDQTHHFETQPTFAMMVRDAGVRELFLVSSEGVQMPSLWPLLPPSELHNGLSTDAYEATRSHRRILRDFNTMDRFPTGWMPKVTAVEKSFWEREALKVIEYDDYTAAIVYP